MWQSILKAPITIGSTKIGLKPLPEDEGDECNRKLKAYADKLKNIKLFYGDLGYTEDKYRVADSYYKNYTRALYDEDVEGYQEIENVSFYYTPVPEEVACRALDLLHNAVEIGMEEKEGRVGDYSISAYFTGHTTDSTFLTLSIWNFKIGRAVVILDHEIYDLYLSNPKEASRFESVNVDWR